MLIESGAEERNGKDAAQARRLEKLRRDFGPVFLGALNDPQTIEILLNADGTPLAGKTRRPDGTDRSDERNAC